MLVYRLSLNYVFRTAPFITQMDDPRMKDVPFEDRFGLLVDIEYNNRKSNSLKRLIKGAGFDQPEAYIADIN